MSRLRRRGQRDTLHKTLNPRIHNCALPHCLVKEPAFGIKTKEKEEFLKACASGDVDTVRALLGTGSLPLNPDKIRDSKLRTPLLVACAAGKTDVVKTLLEFGADPNNPVGDIIGNSPLDLAVISNNVDCVLALLRAGAHMKPIKDHEASTSSVRPKRTPLDLAESRLDVLIRSGQARGTSFVHSTDDEMDEGTTSRRIAQLRRSRRQDVIQQVLQIIQLLRLYIPSFSTPNTTPTIPLNPPSENDTLLQSLDSLSHRLSGMQVERSPSPYTTRRDSFSPTIPRDWSNLSGMPRTWSNSLSDGERHISGYDGDDSDIQSSDVESGHKDKEKRVDSESEDEIDVLRQVRDVIGRLKL